MTKIVEGGSYVAKAIKRGENEHGPWEMLIVKAPGNRQPVIAISVNKAPSNIGISGAFRVDRITSVAHRMWRSPDGSWHYGNVTVKADITGLEDDSNAKYKPRSRSKNKEDDDFVPQFTSLEDFFK